MRGGFREVSTAITNRPHAFELPSLLERTEDLLTARAYESSMQSRSNMAAVAALCSEIDEIAFRLYGISDQDRLDCERDFRPRPHDQTGTTKRPGVDRELDGATELPGLVPPLLEWCVGVAFGRFDIRFATGERPVPAEPEPFDPLPASSPGMLTNDAGLPVDRPSAGYPVSLPLDGILVDDPGHDADIVRRVRQVFDLLDPERGHAWISEIM